MRLMNEIPDSFWSLFRSYNRETYIEALLKISEEYQYNNYYLSREVCIQVLSNFFSQRMFSIMQEEQETDADILEPPATRILNWLVKTKWLKRLEDYVTGITNIIIPDYAAVFVEAFERLSNEEEDDTEVYIQNIYAILYSYKNDAKANERLLKTALVNTKRLNKALQDMLHNMDKFFSSLLEKEFYGDLLKEHLNGYVEEIVKKKYHILKTTDNFYRYKTDIKRWIQEISEKESRELSELEDAEGSQKDNGDSRLKLIQKNKTYVLEMLSDIERGFQDIEQRIAYMDKEHIKYVRASVTRLNYLLNEDRDMKGLVIQLLHSLSNEEDREERVRQIGNHMNFSHVNVLTEKSLFKRRKERKAFTDHLLPEDLQAELTREEVLKLNRVRNQYTKKQIESFIEEKMKGDKLAVTAEMIQEEADFEKLILAYDYSLRKDSKFCVQDEADTVLDNGKFCYPNLTFIRRTQKADPGR